MRREGVVERTGVEAVRRQVELQLDQPARIRQRRQPQRLRGAERQRRVQRAFEQARQHARAQGLAAGFGRGGHAQRTQLAQRAVDRRGPASGVGERDRLEGLVDGLAGGRAAREMQRVVVGGAEGGLGRVWCRGRAIDRAFDHTQVVIHA